MYPENYNTSITTHIQHFLYFRSIISSEIIYSSKVKSLALVISNTTKYQLSSNHHSPCLQTQVAKTRGALLHLLRLHLGTLTHTTRFPSSPSQGPRFPRYDPSSNYQVPQPRPQVPHISPQLPRSQVPQKTHKPQAVRKNC